MRNIAVIASSFIGLALASCQSAGGGAADECGAGDYQSLVGSSIAAVTLPADLNHRVIGPDDAYTMDYRPDRLNIYTDEDGIITEVKCG